MGNHILHSTRLCSYLRNSCSVVQFTVLDKPSKFCAGLSHLMMFIPTVFLLLLITTVMSVSGITTCGGNCPGGCNSCPCGSTRRELPSSSWCSMYSGWDQSSCECIMRHESRGNANAINMNSGGSYDVGLWQINSFNWPHCSNGKAPCSPSANLACAIKVFKWGRNTWKFWATCGKCGVCDRR